MVNNNGGLFVAVGVLAVALGLDPVQGVRLDSQGTSALSSQDSRAAERLLQRAAEALGGAAKLAAIDRLQIAAVEGVSGDSESARRRSLKLWLPDRFQSHYEGVVTHTMNGDRVTFDREISPDVRASRSVAAVCRRSWNRIAGSFADEICE